MPRASGAPSIASRTSGVPMTATTPKQRALDALKHLPQDATLEDAIERLLFIAKVEKGIAEADADKTIPHAEIVKRMKR